MAKINTIGVLTSGGDAPGMNAAIRASHLFSIAPAPFFRRRDAALIEQSFHYIKPGFLFLSI